MRGSYKGKIKRTKIFVQKKKSGETLLIFLKKKNKTNKNFCSKKKIRRNIIDFLKKEK